VNTAKTILKSTPSMITKLLALTACQYKELKLWRTVQQVPRFFASITTRPKMTKKDPLRHAFL